MAAPAAVATQADNATFPPPPHPHTHPPHPPTPRRAAGMILATLLVMLLENTTTSCETQPTC